MRINEEILLCLELKQCQIEKEKKKKRLHRLSTGKKRACRERNLSWSSPILSNEKENPL